MYSSKFSLEYVYSSYLYLHMSIKFIEQTWIYISVIQSKCFDREYYRELDIVLYPLGRALQMVSELWLRHLDLRAYLHLKPPKEKKIIIITI